MNQTQITKCPKCDTTFRVSPAQLKVAKGAVRCGACLHVFRASDHFQLSKQPEAVIQDDRTQDMFEGDVDTANANPADKVSNQPEQKQSQSKPEPKPQAAPIPEKTVTTELVEDPEFDISTPAKTSSVQEPAPVEQDDDFLIDDDNGLIDDNSNDDDLIDDNFGRKTPIINDLNEDFLSLGALDDADPFYTESDKLIDTVKSEDSKDDESWADALLDETPEETVEIKKDLKPAPAKPTFTYIEADPLDLSLPNKASRKQFWILASVSFLLGLTLILQLAYFNFDRWARMDDYRPYYALACEQLGCRLPSTYDVSQIRTTASPQVSSHPRFKDALTVDVLFMNHAPYEQAFPKLDLTFTDKNDNVIAHRLFNPREYLAGEASGLTMMPMETPIHIALEIKDPGPSANNYRVRFVAP